MTPARLAAPGAPGIDLVQIAKGRPHAGELQHGEALQGGRQVPPETRGGANAGGVNAELEARAQRGGGGLGAVMGREKVLRSSGTTWRAEMSGDGVCF